MPEEMRNYDSVILIVDDQVSDIQLLGEAAKGLGVIHFAGNGWQALDLARRIRPDVVLLDIEMPGMDGFEFANTVKNASRWQNTPIVALSSHATPKDLDRGRAAGFSDYVAKFDRDALLHTLSEALNNERGAA